MALTYVHRRKGESWNDYTFRAFAPWSPGHTRLDDPNTWWSPPDSYQRVEAKLDQGYLFMAGRG